MHDNILFFSKERNQAPSQFEGKSEVVGTSPIHNYTHLRVFFPMLEAITTISSNLIMSLLGI